MKKKMKKVLSIICAVTLIGLLVGCSNSNNSNTSQYTAPTSEYTSKSMQSLTESSINRSDTVSSANAKNVELAEPVKVKKSVEKWFGGKETGYISMLTEYDENGKESKITTYTGPKGGIRVTQEYKRDKTSTGTIVTETDIHYDTNKTYTTVRYYNKEGKNTEEYHYDENGKCTFKQVQEYDSSGKKIRLTMDDKDIYEYEYDGHDNLLKEIRKGKIYIEYQYKYDDNGNILEKSQKKYNSSRVFELIETNKYAPEGYLYKKIKYIEPNRTVIFTYNEKGILIDENGRPDFSDTTVHKIYNENNGRLEKKITSTNHTATTNYEYNKEGDLIKETTYDDWDKGSTTTNDYVITYWN